MNWADYAILAVLSVSALISFWRGFTREALSLLAWLTAFWVAISFSDVLAMRFANHVATPSLRLAIAFVGLFVATLLVAAVINFLVGQLISSTGLTGTDRMLGILFGIARGVAVVALLVFVAGLTPLPEDPWWRESVLIGHFQKVAVWLKGFLPDDLGKYVEFKTATAP